MEEINLPSGWVSCKLGEVAELKYGKSLPAKIRNPKGKIPVYGSNGRVGYHTKALTDGPCIVVGRKGSAGAVEFSSQSCWAIDTTYFIKSRIKIEIRFLYFLLKSLRLESLDRSTAIPGLNRKDVYALNILLPPFKEQGRIIEKMERLFTLLDRGEKNIREAHKLLSLYRQSILKNAVAGLLVPQDSDDEPVSELLKRIANEKECLIKKKKIRNSRYQFEDKTIEPPFEIPKSWQWCRLGNIGAIIGGGTPSTANLTNFAKQGEGIPWLTPADLSNYRSLYIERGSRDLSEKGLQSSGATVMPAGTVLFTSRAPIGYTAIASNPISTNQGFKSIVPYITDCSRFIGLTMQAFASHIEAISSGTTFKEATGRLLSAFPIPLPPLTEQQRIIETVDTLFTRMRKLEEEISNVQRLIAHCRQSILKDAFAGRLVHQNSNDQPAIELLAPIQETHLATTRKSTTKNKKQMIHGG